MNDETRARTKLRDDSPQSDNHAAISQTQQSRGGSDAGRPMQDAVSQPVVPLNLIEEDCDSIRPEMLTLVSLDQRQIDAVVQTVPGGAENVQDIYPLSQLQEGMLFHRLLNEQGDTYVLSTLFELSSSEQVAQLADALQKVIARHDVLRTAVLWKQLPRPIQVVYRRAPLQVSELELDEHRDAIEQLKERMRPQRHRMDLQRAPLIELQVTPRSYGGKWYGVLRVHHVICDHGSLQVVIAEVMAYIEGRQGELVAPVAYRNFVAQAQAHAETASAEAFFRSELAGVGEPTAPFGLIDVHGDGSRIEEVREALEPTLAQRIRVQARSLKVSAARLFHAAWALVVAQASGRDDVVYGTVLLAAQQRGAQAQRTLGMSVNTLPLRLQLQGLTAKELVDETNRALTDLLKHEQTPLTLAQRCSGIATAAPLFTALLNYRRNLVSEGDGAAGIRVLGRGEAWTNYPVTLIVDDLGDGFRLTAQSDRRIEPHRVVSYLCTAMHSLLEALDQAPSTLATALSILPEGEWQQVVEQFNSTHAHYAHQGLIHALFEAQVRRTPKAVAVIYEEQSLTYAELNAKANQLARCLRARGVGPDQLVGICVERSLEMVIGLLGILKAGGAYVPLDPGYPAERLTYMLQDAAPRVVLTRRDLRERLSATATELIELDGEWTEIAEQSTDDLEPAGLCSRHLAYVIYTSGSTGQPKGAMNEHRALINRLQWMQSQYQLDHSDRVLQKTPFTFDVSVWEFFWTLMSGATLVIARPQGHQDPDYLRRLIEEQQVTTLHFVPSMLQIFLDQLRKGQCQCLQHVVCSGEELPASLQMKFFECLPHARLSNLYGPTEAAVDVTFWECQPEDQSSRVPIGRPISNVQIHVLDRHGQPAPLGVAGEICIGGVGVGRGYLNRPELTAERFVSDPFSVDGQARMYRTGDLGRWRTDGAIEYLGRNDHQVKIRGFRIELGEIEAQLARHEHVKEVAVLAREDVPTEKHLVAYVTRRTDAEPSAEALRAHLKSVLPEYMVPSAFVTLERLPLTANGKLDRRALPAPGLEAYASREYEAPRGEVEEILAGIWQSLLRVQRVGRQDNFFELGGHSLLIVQMMERLRRVGLSTELRRVFGSPTLADLASALTTETEKQIEVPPNLIPPGCAAITPQMLPLLDLEPAHIERIVQSVPGGAANVQDIYPLAPLQEGMLFHHLLNERGGDTYILSIVLSVSSRKRLDELVTALQAVIDGHDILRTAVLWEGLPRPVQIVYRQTILPVQEIAPDSCSDAAEQIKERLKPERQRLNVQRAPLLQLQMASDPERMQWYVLLQLHHMVIDHVTLELLTAEVVAILQGHSQQQPASTPYRDHVAQALARAHTDDAETFFRGKFGKVDEPTAPFGLLDVHGDGSRIEEASEEIEAALASRVRTQARRLGVSAATLFHAAWGLVVAHTSGRDDVVFGSLLLGRLHGTADAQRILGVFINTLPLRLQLQGTTASELVEQTQRELVELLSHEQASLTVAQRCSGIVGSAPLFTTLLNYRHSVSSIEAQWSGAEGIALLGIQERTNYPITLTVDDLGEGFTLTAQTDRRIDPQRMTGYVHAALQSLVEALEQSLQVPALTLSVLPRGERRQVIELFNGTQAAYPQEKLLHELFEEQVERTPDAVAAVYEGESLKYAELNHRANQLAWYLRGRGAGPDQLVALCVERNLDLVVALLGIIKSGAAYLPLDPNYPPERLQYMLEDARPRMLLTQTSLRERLRDTGVDVVSLDDERSEITQTSTRNLDMRAGGLRTRHLAYVIYTSGSTGKPKGVMVEHRNVTRLFAATAPWFEFNERDVWTLFHSFAFDFSVWELWGALLYGGRVVVVPHLTARSPQEFYRLVCEQGVTVLNQTPSAFAQLIDAQARSVGMQHSLRVIVFGGEALELHTLQPWVRRNGADEPRLVNMYGITETTVHVTYRPLTEDEINSERGSLIGKPIPDLQVYLLDRYKQPVPIGVAGEMYVGGGGVARGYLNRPELTAERFIADPFSGDPQAHLYKSGDLARWRTDGTLEYLGRNDDQVKIRGFRIELGEIGAQLARHEQVKEAAVIAREDVPGEKRLVAYVVANGSVGTPSIEALRAQLKSVLPEYMVPSAFVMLESLPLTANGKLDRRMLPAPELGAYASRQYETPRGDVEEILAGIWQSLLRVERVGRQDNFFELGGHSLLIVQMMERLRRVGLATDVRRVFESPTLTDLASALTRDATEQFEVPPNLIPAGCPVITPEMLPLLELEGEHIERIVQSVPGGAANIQDIYPLAPLQEGMLFHHLLNERGGDTYVLPIVLSVSSRERLAELVTALQTVIDSHDILRTAVLWEQLPFPVQVIYRRAVLPVQEVSLDPARELAEQIAEWIKPERQRLDLRQAPLLRLQVAADPSSGQWYALLQFHHIAIDHVTLEIVTAEVVSHLEGHAHQLPASVPYRNHVAQSLAYARMHDADAFFRSKLGDIDEPTAPFGLLDVHGDGTQIEEAREQLEPALALRVRTVARRLGVTAATLFHAAWALVVAHTSAREDVVFGSLLLGRLQGSAGAQRILGVFINTLPLRLRLRGVTAKELVEQTQRELVELLSHEQASLAAAQRCSGIVGSAPLFSALLNYRHSAAEPDAKWSGARGITVLAEQERTNYPFALSVDDLGEGFGLTAQTDRRIEPRRITTYMHIAVQSLIGALEQAPQTPALALSILPEDERRQVLERFNDTHMEMQEGKLVHELFEEQVERTPDAVAVICKERQLTYSQLNRRANQLAHALLSCGVRADERVAVAVERDLEMIVGMLAILKAGGAYLPLDVNHPAERLAHMLRDSTPCVVLTQSRLRSALPESASRIVVLDAEESEIGQLPDTNPDTRELGLQSRNVAYVIYTSGSTGIPKGVMVEHASVVNMVHWTLPALGLREGSRCSSTVSIGFDPAGWEIWPALSAGATLFLAPGEIIGDPEALLSWWVAQPLDISLLLTPMAEFAFSRNIRNRRLKTLLIGGDRLRYRPKSEAFSVINNYGPTEATVLATSGRVRDEDDLIHIGKPIGNTRIYILGSEGQPTPVGVAGEIHIAGAALARGYLNRPEVTAERFVRNPFSDDPLARMYKTGDLGRWRPDGTVEYVGRNDHQIKIRGYRIELGEIEAQLAHHAQVKDVVVIAREDASGLRLVAYVVPDHESTSGVSLSAEELRTYLKSVLPDYMVPSAFVTLERLPLTPNGKVDRRALPAPEFGAFLSRQYEAPRGEVEEILAGIWQGLLGLERVGRRDNFFELGGHSLLIVQMKERLRRVGLSAELRIVFESPTLADLAEALTPESVVEVAVPPNLIRPECGAITPDMLTLVDLDEQHIQRIVESVPGGAANIEDIYPLAPLQEGILFHHLLDEQGGDTYVLAALFSVRSRGRLEEFIAALQTVIDRHDVLRTAILWEQLPRPVQVVYRQASMSVAEITFDRDRDLAEQIKEWMSPARQRLDLRQAPLLRLQIAADPHSADWYVLLQLHHITSDHVTSEIVIAEVVAHLQGRVRQFAEAVAYRNHVAQALQYARLHDAEAFFREKLGDIDEPTAPFGLTDIHRDGTQIVEARTEFDAEMAQLVRRQARRLGVSAATLFHAAWGLVVAHTSGRDDVVFGSVLLGRLQGSADAQRTLGMFINTLPLRLHLQGISVKELVERTQRELVQLLAHEQASLAVAQRCSRIVGSAPLFSALLNYRHSAANAESLWADAEGMRLRVVQERTNYPITLSVDDYGKTFALTAQTDRRVDPQRMIDYLRTAILSVVQELELAPQTPALELRILPDRERQQVVELFNATQTVFPEQKLVHQLFEEQAMRMPSSIAVEHSGRSLTYSELDAKANRLASHLRHRGVCADRLVGICMERSVEMVTAVLATLKAGGAYLPLDPSYPAERLQHMLADATPRVVLTQKTLQAALPATQAEVIELTEDMTEIAGGADIDALPTQSSSNLVYVIYTSGSTGRPKGTAMEHRSMVNLIEWHRDAVGARAGQRVLQFAALSFDVAFQEIFSTLCTGGTLVLLDEWVRRDARALAQLLNDRSIERLFVPPLILQSLAECCRDASCGLESLRDVVTAGEQLRISPEIASLFKRLEGCRLHNHYGPTESHVVAALTLTGTPDEWPVLPSIGRPIANTQLHILNDRRQHVPTGAGGEIYIGGVGVARGYLGRPLLTEQRFIPDPFSPDPQARLYKTGDLGRWQPDGTVEYLGRNDEQVKIRGYRIELGEIEAQLCLHPDVTEAAVVSREDASGARRLVAYIVRSGTTGQSVEDMRLYLKGVLPEYMVPSAFVTLAALPTTPSGKVNRRALPAPDLDAYATRSYETPQGEVEQSLAGIWQTVLGIERVGRLDSFFELGGHSLLALKALVKINEALEVNLRVTDLYKSPTIQELAMRIAAGSVADELVDLRREATLGDEITALPGHVRVPARNVLLTGGTGFVGRFLLVQLLHDTDATIHCLVRAQSEQRAALRLRSTLLKWDLWRDEFEGRIVAIPGDLRMPRLGIAEDTFEHLCHSIDVIYHCATSMNHLETYAMAKPANVGSARELLKLATRHQPKSINYISTLGIFGSSAIDEARTVSEDSPIDHERHPASEGYLASKWVSEKIFMIAGERGIPCNIFRLGLVWADTQLGRFDELQSVYRVLKSCLLAGRGIEGYRYPMAPIPVDYVARAIVSLANCHLEGQRAFHLSGTEQRVDDVFERCGEIAGVSLELLPYYEWIREIKRLHLEGYSLPAVPIVDFAFSLDEASFHQQQRSRRSAANVRFDSARTQRQLEQGGMVAATFDEELLRLCVEDMLSRDPELQHLVDWENPTNSLMVAKPRVVATSMSKGGDGSAFVN